MAEVSADILVKFKVDSKNGDAHLDTSTNKVKKLAQAADLTNAAMGKLSNTMSIAEGEVKDVINQGFDRLEKKINEQRISFDALNSSIQNTTKKYKDLNKAQQQAAGMADKITGRNTRNAAQANRFNSSNVLAQFQDIAVTSAMGMNPMLIAMQQGTQLQYIFANSNAPLKDFVAGLKSAVSGVGLLTIGLTGLTAAFIQMVDWSKVGKSVLNGLGNVFDFLGDHIVTLSALVLVLIGNFIWLNQMTILFNAGLLAAGIQKAAVAMWAFAKAAGAAKLAMAADWIKTNKVLLIITVTVLGLAAAFEKLYKKMTGKSIIDSLGDTFHKLADKISGVETAVKKADKALKDWLNVLDKEWESIEDKRFEDSIKGLSVYEQAYQKKLRELTKAADEAKFKGVRMSPQAELDIKAIAKENALIEEQRDKFEKNQKAINGNIKAVDKLAEAWDKLQTSSQNKINDLVMQQNLIGAGTYEKTYVQTLNDAMRQAQSSGLDLYSTTANGKTIYETLNENAKATAALTEENERLDKSYEFTKSTVKGFFSDMRQGLRDGQSAWETFGNAVTNVLDKILDKIMDIGVDALFSAGTGYFGKSAMGAYGMFGGLGSGTNTTGIGGLKVGETSGNLTYLGNIAANANGGVYSNGIYNSPTLFKFGKGGRFGLMGEAGPEAVMPLTRGPDGSLGVRADNTSVSPVVVNVINNSNAQAKVEQRQTSQGMEIDVMIDQLVAEKMNQPGTSSNTALRAFNNQKLIAR